MMNYKELLEDLKKRGYTHYRINKETGITYRTLKRLKSGETKNPRIETHNSLVMLRNKLVTLSGKRKEK